MISKLITYFKHGFLTETELNRIAIRELMLEQLTDNNKYTEVNK